MCFKTYDHHKLVLSNNADVRVSRARLWEKLRRRESQDPDHDQRSRSETAVVFKTDNHLPITENQSPHGKCWDDRQTMFATEQGHEMSTSV